MNRSASICNKCKNPFVENSLPVHSECAQRALELPLLEYCGSKLMCVACFASKLAVSSRLTCSYCFVKKSKRISELWTSNYKGVKMTTCVGKGKSKLGAL